MADNVLTVSISRLLASGEPKPYFGTAKVDGFEWGVGRSGEYAAHAHKIFCDVLFSPMGMQILVEDKRLADCNLFIAAPGVYFSPKHVGDFWFMKFVTGSEDQRPKLPEKVEFPIPGRRPGARYVGLSAGETGFTFSDWDKTYESVAHFELRRAVTGALALQVTIAAGRSFLVVA